MSRELDEVAGLIAEHRQLLERTEKLVEDAIERGSAEALTQCLRMTFKLYKQFCEALHKAIADSAVDEYERGGE